MFVSTIRLTYNLPLPTIRVQPFDFNFNISLFILYLNLYQKEVLDIYLGTSKFNKTVQAFITSV